MDTFNYKGSISKHYSYKKYNEVLSCVGYGEFAYSKSIECQVTAYAYSNIDAFGAQVLCWHNDLGIANAITSEVSASAFKALSADEKYGPAWNQISDEAIADATEINKKGWMSVNNRALTPTP